jgi:hypothetical protein
MKNLSRCCLAAALCLAAVFIFINGRWARIAAQSRTVEGGPQSEVPAPPKPVQLKTMPVQPAAPPTAEELSHIVAYYVASTHTLHIRNSEHLVQGIGGGKFLASWTKGASTATIRGADGRSIRADVVADSPNDVPPSPKVGDTRYVEYENIDKASEEVLACEATKDAAGKRIGSKEVYRQYSFLIGDGKESGTETYSTVSQNYYYHLKDCSSGYYDRSNRSSDWALTVSAWPNP